MMNDITGKSATDHFRRARKRATLEDIVARLTGKPGVGPNLAGRDFLQFFQYFFLKIREIGPVDVDGRRCMSFYGLKKSLFVSDGNSMVAGAYSEMLFIDFFEC